MELLALGNILIRSATYPRNELLQTHCRTIWAKVTISLSALISAPMLAPCRIMGMEAI